MLDVLNDIAEIVKFDKDHDTRVIVDSFGIVVELICEPIDEDDCIIPIRFNTLNDFAYIPDDEYRNKFHPNDFGIDLEEINLIQKIMVYFESHKEEICNICGRYSSDNRK